MINFYEIVKTDQKALNPNFKVHGISIPFRAIVCAPSGKGKTNQIMNLIVLMDKTFHKIVLCVKSAQEPLYQHLITKLGNKVEVYEGGEIPKISHEDNDKKDDKKDEKKPKKILQSLIIFDDLMYDNSPEILQYYIRGRKFGYSCVYIAQTYWGAPIDVRKNSDYIFLGQGLLKRDIKAILNMYPSNIPLDEFIHIYDEATKEPLDILLIDLEHRNLRYNIKDKITDF
jgi:hypothetical protein